MKTLTLMQGIPGSGKSTMAKFIADRDEAIIFSTDDFWIHRYEHDVAYEFDASRLGEAHQWNQQRTAKEMASADGGDIVIDNTNILRQHVQPYLALAQIFDYEVRVVRVEVPVEVAIERNAKRPVDRRVPSDSIRRMASQMETLLVEKLPPKEPEFRV